MLSQAVNAERLVRRARQAEAAPHVNECLSRPTSYHVKRASELAPRG